MFIQRSSQTQTHLILLLLFISDISQSATTLGLFLYFLITRGEGMVNNNNNAYLRLPEDHSSYAAATPPWRPPCPPPGY